MFFALLHELGHLIVGMILGFKLESMLIFPFGFAIKFKDLELNSYMYDTNKSIELRKILTAIAGPFINFIIISFLKGSNVINEDIDIIIFSNVLIAVFNILPIYPLDGGRILKCLFNIFFDKDKSYTYIQNISYIFMFMLTFFCSILMYSSKNIVFFFIIVYLWAIVIKEDRISKMKKSYFEMFNNVL